MWERTPSTATALSGSESKKAAMSLAIETRCSTSMSGRVVHGCAPLAWARGLRGLPPLLPRGRLRHLDHLHRGYLVLGTVRGPVGIVRGDEVGARLGKMERGVHHARRDSLGDLHAQHRVTGAAGDAHPVAMLDAARLGVVRMDLEAVLAVPGQVRRAARLRADVV